jgi:hypothetical protein
VNVLKRCHSIKFEHTHGVLYITRVIYSIYGENWKVIFEFNEYFLKIILHFVIFCISECMRFVQGNIVVQVLCDFPKLVEWYTVS